MEANTNFVPVRTQRAFEVVCNQVRTLIAEGALRPGDKLPAERELAAQFQISRNAVREALRSLEVAGVIRNEKGVKGGAFIRDVKPDHIAQAVQDYVRLGDISLDELTEARRGIQEIVVRLACERATDRTFDELEDIVEQTRETSDVSRRYELAVRFYAVLVQATGNRIYGLFVDALSSILHEFVKGPSYRALQEDLIESRRRLVKALRVRDGDAAVREMLAHLDRIHTHVAENVSAE